MDKPLAGEIALVTGSGRGLGYCIADRLAQLGAAIAVHDVSRQAPAEFGEAGDLDSVAAKIAVHGVKTAAVTGDIGDEAAVDAMVAAAEKALGPITVLINCAGGDIAAKGGKPKPNNALGIPLVDIRALIDRNLIGTMIVSKAVCPGMAGRKHGAVVNIASVDAHSGRSEGVVYSVAKAGIVQYSRCLAAELRPHGVRVNVISPGPTKTARFLATRAVDPRLMDESAPLQPYAKPEEIADAVAMLCLPTARFVNGQVIRVDGGETLFAG